jgi:purine-cytosine permease-like protein
VSIQNLRPRWDRRPLTIGIGTLLTLAAFKVQIGNYYNFLALIGAVFVPLSGVLVAAWLRSIGRPWDVSADAPLRIGMLLSWLVGFVAYQLINPGALSGWSSWWTSVGDRLHTTGHVWLSASITSFVVALLVAMPFAAPTTRRVPPEAPPAG